MKKGIFIGSVSGIMLMGALMWFGISANNKNYYQPRTDKQVEAGAHGAAEYMHKLRANQVTGEIDPADVEAAKRRIASMAQNKTSALNLQWTEMGPSDGGGRSRSIIFDKDNSQLMFAGSVSGGIFKSTNGGRSWNEVNDQLPNLAVVSLAQGSDGTIYAGTGEGMYYFASGNGSGGILGDGIYKSTDGGNTFTQIPSTDPATNGNGWRAVGKIEVDPNNANKIFAATARGLQLSEDGGDTWNSVLPGNISCPDMTMTSSGVVWAVQNGRVYKVETDGTFNQVSGGDLPDNGGRTRIAVAPQDENYVYAIQTNRKNSTDRGESFDKAFQSTDGGATWTEIGTISSLLNPHRFQGGFNNALAVDPKDKERILVGGVEFWEWSATNGWVQLATNSRFGGNFYVHSDNHQIKFHPTNLNTFYICNDGGIYKSTDNGFTYTQENKGYATTQYYGIAVNRDGLMLGGTQDNSNIIVDPNSVLPTAGTTVFSGDGGKTALSRLDPSVWFLASQYGNLARSADAGENFNGFYSGDVLGSRSGSLGGSAAFAEFVTPFAFHEELKDPGSQEFIVFAADSINSSIGFGDGSASYTDTVLKPQASTRFIDSSFVIRAGTMVLTSDGSGNLTGDGTGTFDASTGRFTVTFNAPTNFEIFYDVATYYDPGAPILLESRTNDLPIYDTLVSGLQPNDSINIQDPVQSIFVVGLTAYANTAQPNNQFGGIWMTRYALTRKNGTPEWWHVGRLNNDEIPSSVSISNDGNYIWVGTNSGRVFRISNIDSARSEETADIDEENGVPSNALVEQKVVFNSNGRAITNIAIDPRNSDRVMITLGSYGNTDYIHYTERGTNPNLNQALFTNVTGDLPRVPVYDATFNAKDASGGQVIIGTDYGIFTTDDITAASVSWTQENSGMATVPVFDILQDMTVRTDLSQPGDFEGDLYIGTHGRGIFRSTSTVGYVGIGENKPEKATAANTKALDMYPNPAHSRFEVGLNLENTTDVKISIRDISGKLVKVVSMNSVPAGTESLPVNISDLKTGTYIVTATYDKTYRTGKLLVTK